MSEPNLTTQHEVEKSALITQNDADQQAIIAHYEARLAAKDKIIDAQSLVIEQQSKTIKNIVDEKDDQTQATVTDANQVMVRAESFTRTQLLHMSAMASKHVTQTRRARIAEHKSEWQKNYILDLELAVEQRDKDFMELEKRFGGLHYERAVLKLREKIDNMMSERDILDRRIRVVNENIRAKDDGSVSYAEGEYDDYDEMDNAFIETDDDEEADEEGAGEVIGEDEAQRPSSRFSRTMKRFVRGL